MTFDEVLGTVTTELTKMAAKIGFPVLGVLSPDLKPIGEMGMFDSLNGIELTAIFEHKFKVALGENVFSIRDGGRLRAASIREAATTIFQALTMSRTK